MEKMRPSGRWSEQETNQLAEMRDRMAVEIQSRRQLPDVVGDRRLLRFLRGHKHNVPKACEKYLSFLRWRDENNVDGIRDNILRNPSVNSFPGSEKILALVPQIIIAHDALDNYGNPISFEDFSFDPDAVIRSVTKDEYVTFMIYTLEYRTLVLEQLSDQREEEYLRAHNYCPPSCELGYGVMLQVTCIRDCHGLGFSHISSAGKTVLNWIIEVAASNYPETLFRSYMIRVPLMVDAIWFIIKGLLDPNTVAKNVMVGSGYKDRLLQDMPVASIPSCLGGDYEGFNALFSFNNSDSGSFVEHVDGAISQLAVVKLPDADIGDDIADDNTTHFEPGLDSSFNQVDDIQRKALRHAEIQELSAPLTAFEIAAYLRSIPREPSVVVLTTNIVRDQNTLQTPAAEGKDSENAEFDSQYVQTKLWNERSLFSSSLEVMYSFSNASEFLCAVVASGPPANSVNANVSSESSSCIIS